jgi:hypothetical protein
LIGAHFVIAVYEEQSTGSLLLLLNSRTRFHVLFQIINGVWSAERYEYRQHIVFLDRSAENMVQEGCLTPPRAAEDQCVLVTL